MSSTASSVASRYFFLDIPPVPGSGRFVGSDSSGAFPGVRYSCFSSPFGVSPFFLLLMAFPPVASRYPHPQHHRRTFLAMLPRRPRSGVLAASSIRGRLFAKIGGMIDDTRRHDAGSALSPWRMPSPCLPNCSSSEKTSRRPSRINVARRSNIIDNPLFVTRMVDHGRSLHFPVPDQWHPQNRLDWSLSHPHPDRHPTPVMTRSARN